MNIDMDSIIIDINSTVSDSGKAIDVLIEKLNSLRDALSGVGRASNEFKNLAKNISSGSSSVASLRARKTPNVEMPSLEKQTSQLGVSLNSKDIVSNIKTINSEFTKYKNELGQVVTVQKKMKDGMDQYKVSVKDTVQQTSAFEKFKNSIQSTVSNIAQMYFGFTRAWGIMGDLVETSSEYTEAVNLFYTEMGTKSKEAEKWVKRFSEALYLDPKDVMQYMGAFNSLIHGLGVGVENSYKMSKNLTQLAYDLASYKNISFEQAYDKLSSGIAGQIKGLRQVGVALSQNTLQELANQMGIKTRVKEMDEASKAQLRYIQIMRSSTNWQGDLGKTMMSTENILKSARQQWTLMTRALGDLAAVLVRAVMPYFIAATQLIKEAAVSLAKFFGFDIDFSDSFKNSGIKAASTGLDKVANSVDNVGKTAKKTKNEINKMLAPFDDLNVVQTKVQNAGAGTGAGTGTGGGASIGNLDLPEYDALSKLTSEWSDKIAKAKEQIKKFLPIVKKIAKAIAAMWVVGKIAKFIKNLQTLGSVFKLLRTPLSKVGDIFKILIGRFADGYGYAKALGGSGLSAVLSGARNLLGPLGQVALVAGGMAISFATGYTEMKKYAKGTEDLGSALGKTTAVTLAFAAAAAVFVGWPAAAAVAIAGVTGALLGYSQGLHEVEVHNQIFNGQGVKIKDVSDSLAKSFEYTGTSITKYGDNLKSLSSKYTSAQSEAKSARQAVDSFTNSLDLQDGKVSTSQLNELKEKYKTLKQETNNAQKASQEYYIALIKANEKILGSSNETTAKEIANYKKKASAAANYVDEYIAKEEELNLKYYSGKMSAEDYQKAIQNLKVEYGYAKQTTMDTSKAIDVFSKSIKELDYTSVKETTSALKDTKKVMNEQVKTLKEYKENVTSANKKANEGYKEQIKNLEYTKTYGKEWTTEQEKHLQALYNIVDTNNKETKKAVKEADTAIKDIQGSYKGYMEAIYVDLVSKGADTSSEFTNIIKTLKTEIKGLDKVDASGAGKALKDSFIKSVITNEPKMIEKVKTSLERVGSKAPDSLVQAFNDQMEVKKQKFVRYAEQKFANPVGKACTQGLKDSIDKNKSSLDAAGNDVADFLTSATKNRLKINSPSKVYEEIGKNTILGLANGITTNEKQLTSAMEKSISKMDKSAKDSLKKIKFEMSASDFQKSLDKLLGKLQSFANKFKSGVNSLMSTFTTTMNGITVGKDNKVYYTKMPSITIPRFEQGGYPEKASLFWANENGIPEMIGQIGNKTAVANNDQITTSITNALIDAFSGMSLGGQGTTVVYIGNKKVYEGMGEYINSENERYGTSYIKI